MKKLSISIVALAGLFAIQSCTPGPPPSPYHITASPGSMGSFTSTGASVTNGGANGFKIWITGTNSAGAKMNIILNPYPGTTGTYALAYSGNTGCEYFPPGGGAAIRSVYGTVTLTSVSPGITGTFVFTGQDSSVNTGSFHVPPPTM